MVTARRTRRRREARDDGRPADLGFMRAIHAGLRRDAARLESLAQRRAVLERPEFLTWVLDDASDEDAAAGMTELPTRSAPGPSLDPAAPIRRPAALAAGVRPQH
jgi:hypothetical protein